MELQRVKIINQTDGMLGTQCFVGDVEIHRVKSVDFKQSVDEVPTFIFETLGLPDIETLADVQFRYTPHTTQEAAKVLKHSLMTDEDLYNAFVASINSVLKPKERYIGDGEFKIHAEYGSYYLAKEIADRIIGIEGNEV